MARLPRIDVPGIAQHVISRGNDRQACFFSDDDFATYRTWLDEAASRHECAVHAFVLMTNHIHLLMTGHALGAVGATMQALGRRYVRRVNYRYRRTGTLFEGRYKASLVESERYALACMRYIELNPVRAAMVGHPAEYRWSSFRANTGIESIPGLQPHAAYWELGASGAERADAYRKLFDTELSEAEVEAIRIHAQKDCVLGSPRFQAHAMGRPARSTYAGS